MIPCEQVHHLPDGAACKWQSVVKAHELLWHHFIKQHEEPPKEIVLEFDDTDVPVHGDQPGKFFNAYYGHHCYFKGKVTRR